jgi:signal transduction histidine kinase
MSVTPEDNMETTEVVGIRPYARLLTMLGEQLIKNDRIALVELIKNSYDADAGVVRVDFINFSPGFKSSPVSKLAITDDGDGMSEATIRNHWLNPATPGKLDLKAISRKTPGGRVVQGEKGIGRFAMFKLGNRVRIVTRAKGTSDEFVIDFDLSFLDTREDSLDTSREDHLPHSDPSNDSGHSTHHVFIDEIQVRLTRREPLTFTASQGPGHGTTVEISGLRSTWTEAAVRAAYSAVRRLQPLVPQKVNDALAPTRSTESSSLSEFDVEFLRDGIPLGLREEQDTDLRRLFDERAVLSVSGHFSNEELSFLLLINGHTSVVPLDDPAIAGLRIYRRYFADKTRPNAVEEIECGSFDFSLYVFDLTPQAPVEYRLDPDERDTVREHRIYLYRDGVRVLPYGDADDDWLQLDVIRGTQGADRVLSNDQTVGFVYITQENNPHLRDKTNREGLLETGHALTDFVTLLQLIISYLRRGEFARYVAAQQQRKDATHRREQEVPSGFRRLLEDPRMPASLTAELRKLERGYLNEREYMTVRVDRTEDLAGVGLSVEAASHDIVSSANQGLRMARSVAKFAKNWHPDEDVLVHDSASVVEALAFVTSRLEDVQGLFVSTRTGKRLLEPAEFVSRVYRIYSTMMREQGVVLDLQRGPKPLQVRTTDAALLQAFINLFDNSLYWMSVARTSEPVIRVVVDAAGRRITFGDNGPGVRAEDAPYIFEPFFSGKGESGKGLGLYIARQVGERNGFEIDLVSRQDDKVASGANFVLTFPGAGST